MASSRVSASTGRSRSSGRSRDARKGSEPAVSGVRWAGVGLVIAALLGAITLAVVSPSDPTDVRAVTAAQPTAPATIKPEARVPETEVRIISPADGDTTDEREMVITVTVPEYELPKDTVELQIYRDGKPVKGASRKRPPADDIEIGPIGLREGRNEITAALTTSGGPGPISAPIAIIVDKAGPELKVDAPRENERVLTRTITVTGTTEVGATVTVRNKANGAELPETVGPSGAFDISMTLVDGDNKIVVSARDEAGNVTKPPIRRNVIRVDPVPVVGLKLSQNEIPLSALPKKIVMTVNVSDSTERALKGAEVIFIISVPNQAARTEPATTNGDGQARWSTTIPAGSAKRGEGFVTVEVKANGETKSKTKKLTIK